MPSNKIDENIEDDLENYIEDLKDLLSQPSISTTGEGITECVELVRELCKKYGFDEIEKIKTPGNPAIIARAFADIDEKYQAPTLLIYGHYDVQPVDNERWTTLPFKPDIREGKDGRMRIYARGAGDNKGQWFTHLCAVKTMRDLDGLPINILLLLEGEEEKGSPNLREVVKGREEFQEVELAYISDGPIDESNRPQVLLGVRGLLYVELQANGADKDLHSGIYGGPLPNPAWELIRILDSMKDENGKINIDGFYEDVLDITDEDKEVLKEIPVDEERIKKELGIDSFAEGPGDSYHEKLIYHPTLNIPGFTSGYTGEGVKTIIPCEAKAKIDMRLVADQDPDDIFKKFSEHVKERGSESVNVEIVFHDSMKPYRIPLDSPLVKPMMKAVRGAWKQEPVLKPAAGGSLPSYVFAEELGIDCVVVPYANADENNHSPDENLALDCFEKGIKTTCRVAKYMSETY